MPSAELKCVPLKATYLWFTIQIWQGKGPQTALALQTKDFREDGQNMSTFSILVHRIVDRVRFLLSSEILALSSPFIYYFVHFSLEFDFG